MAELLSAHIMRLMPQAMHMYHRLVLVVAPLGAGKTSVLREVAQQTGYNYINVNLELSQRMLELTQRQRQLQVSRLLRDRGRGEMQSQVPSECCGASHS